MKLLPLFATLGLTVIAGHGAVIYDESISGDLSGNFASPDVLTLSNGANTIIAQMGNNGDTGATNGQDADYFSFVVGAGESVTAINVDSFTFTPGDPNLSFMGYVAAAGFGGQTAGDIDGQVLFNAASGDVFLTLVGAPLGPGTYSFWVQETSPNIVDYQLTITQIPEPATALMVGLGVCGLMRRQRR